MPERRSRQIRRLAVALAAACAWTCPALRADPLLLSRIKIRMRENLNRLPNYTCLQTIERSKRPAPSRRWLLVDTLRLEVALVEGKEMFSWPGAGRFEDKKLGDLVGGGTIGNGSFALHARSVFSSTAPTFTFAGERQREGRRTWRYDYVVPLMLSGYHIRVSEHEAVVGYHGSLWADAETLDLIRLEVHADDIPPHLPLSSASDAMEYARARIGDGEFLLPQSSELVMEDLYGNESRNRTQFSACRQYAGESFLIFAEPTVVEEVPTAVPVREVRLPTGLALDLELETTIEFRSAAVGDPIAARLRSDARQQGRVIVPKGAQVSGRIVRLERIGLSSDYLIIGLQFSGVEFDNSRAEFLARLEEAMLSPFASTARPGGGAAVMLPRMEQGNRPGLGIIHLRSGPLRLAKGFRMIWRTENTGSGNKP